MIKINISTPPIIAKTLAVSGFAASVLLAATPAHAISFNFQFQDTGCTCDFVKGTVSGLVEGNNSGQGITATVTSSPGGGVGSGYSFSSTNGSGLAFTVTKGNITFADALFVNDANNTYLSLGTPGNNGFSSQLIDIDGVFDYLDLSNSTIQFTAATPVPFESSPIALPASLAVCFGAAKLLRNHLAKKRMVSVEA